MTVWLNLPRGGLLEQWHEKRRQKTAAPYAKRYLSDLQTKHCILLQNALYCYHARNKGGSMATAVRVSKELVKEAKIYSKVDKRSITGQIEHWATIGKCVEENPDLTYNVIKDILIGLAELDQGESSEYQFG